MQTEAPNFSGTYPLAGEKIGPAWRDCWAQLQADSWVDGLTLATEVAEAHGLDAKTTAGLLAAARRGRLLEVRYVLRRSRKRAEYRVAPVS